MSPYLFLSLYLYLIYQLLRSHFNFYQLIKAIEVAISNKFN